MNRFSKWVTKKNIPIALGILPFLLWLAPLIFFSVYGNYASGGCRDDNFCGASLGLIGLFALPLSPLLFSLIISVPAYFMREEVHTYWFDRMVVLYLPIGCLLVFLSTLPSREYGGGFGPSVGGIEILLTLLVVSIGFIFLSLVWISKKYAALKRAGK